MVAPCKLCQSSRHLEQRWRCPCSRAASSSGKARISRRCRSSREGQCVCVGVGFMGVTERSRGRPTERSTCKYTTKGSGCEGVSSILRCILYYAVEGPVVFPV